MAAIDAAKGFGVVVAASKECFSVVESLNARVPLPAADGGLSRCSKWSVSGLSKGVRTRPLTLVGWRLPVQSWYIHGSHWPSGTRRPCHTYLMPPCLYIYLHTASGSPGRARAEGSVALVELLPPRPFDRRRPYTTVTKPIVVGA